MNAYQPVRSELFEVWKVKGGKSRDIKLNHVRDHVLSKLVGISKDNCKSVKKAVARFCSELEKRWTRANCTLSRFVEANAEWLKGSVFPKTAVRKAQGRPQKSFTDLNKQNKRRRIKVLRNSETSQELAYATEMNARADGSEDAAKFLHEALQTTPTRATKIRQAWKAHNDSLSERTMSADEGLSLFIDGDFSKDQWMLLRNSIRHCNVPQIYPSYKSLVQARQRCLPDNIKVSEISAETRLQSLMDHTAKRILSLDIPQTTEDLELVSKWGFDGSSDHSNYKQRFSNEDSDDSSVFITSMVPLQLRLRSNPSKILWMNQRPSSTRLCRPIRMQFIKETAAVSLQEKEYFDEQIQSLMPTNILGVKIHHVMVCSMVDGKVCSSVTGISTQKCFVCHASPKQFNDLDTIESRSVDKSTFQFGLSPLHARIRFMECLLHIAYRLESKCWQARTPIQKEKLAARKKVIQKEFKRRIGLLIDIPKHGSGSSNDGNTARRFFEDPNLTANITGLKVELIEKFAVILSVLACGQSINVTAFKNFCHETAKCYVRYYGWYYMPSSVHRILIHGADIISAAIVPIGCLSEEPQECRNKDLKRFRENHSRKCSRESSNYDIFIRLLITSDPFIASLRQQRKKKSQLLSPTAIRLLQNQPIVNSSSDSESSETEHMNL